MPKSMEVVSKNGKVAQHEKEKRLTRISEDLERVKKEARVTFGLKCELERQLRESEEKVKDGSV